MNLQRVDKAIADGDQVVRVVEVHLWHELWIRVGARVLGVNGQVAADAERVRFVVLVRFTFADLTALAATQLGNGDVGDIGLLVLAFTGTVHDEETRIRDALRHGNGFHVVHAVIVEQADLVEVDEERVGTVDPEVESESRIFCDLMRKLRNKEGFSK